MDFDMYYASATRIGRLDQWRKNEKAPDDPGAFRVAAIGFEPMTSRL